MVNLMDTLKKGIDKEDAILIEKFPIKSLSLSKRGINQSMMDVRQNRGSFTKGPVEVMYNIENGQFIITDGYHRIVDYLSKKKQFIPVKIWSTTYSDYYANIQKDDLFFVPVPINSFPSFGEAATIKEQTNILDNPNFKKWFGNSKVVDKEGKPLVVYHGTKSNVEYFDIKKFGASDQGLVGKGFYFTYSGHEAGEYSLNTQYGKGENSNVIPCYVSLQKPFLITQGVLPDGRTLRDISQDTMNGRGGYSLRKEIEGKGYDGIIFTDRAGEIRHVVSWYSTQIKSAIGNIGDFNADDPNIIKDIVTEEHKRPGGKKARSFVAVFRYKPSLEVLLVKDRKGRWTMPGGQADTKETYNETAWRELEEETNIVPDFIKHWDKIEDEDKITHAYYGEVTDKQKAKSGTDAKGVKWSLVDKIDDVKDLKDFHKNIIKDISKEIYDVKKEIKEAMRHASKLNIPLSTFTNLLLERKRTIDGYLIVMEGIDGAGKSTQCDNLKNWLEDKGWKVTVSKWSNSPAISDAIKAGKKSRWLSPTLFCLLNASDMIWRYENVIKPSLDKGHVVICDRFYYTSYVRDILRGVRKELLDEIYKNFLEPDLILHFIVPPDVAVARLLKDKGFKWYSAGRDIGYSENEEQSALKYEKEMDKIYKSILPKIKNYKAIKTTRTIDEIFKEIKEFVREKIQSVKKTKFKKMINESVFSIKKTYSPDSRFGLGVVSANGGVDFKEFSRDTFGDQIHGRMGNPGGANTFRYADGIVDWSNGHPSNELKDIVNSYLEKRGFPVKKHVSYYDIFGKPDDDIDESIQKLDERLSFADLYDDTDDERIFKSKLPGMRVRPMAISMENGNETWNFGYTSQEKSQYQRHGGKSGHKGRIIFFKDSVEPEDNAEDLECMVDCDCKDFQFRFSYVDAQQDASVIGPNSLNKATNAPPIKTNPEGETKLCKHLAALVRYLVTNIDRARERAHLRHKPVNIFETMDEISGRRNDKIVYYDKDDSLNEVVNKIGYDPEHNNPDLPMNWDAIDIPLLQKWDRHSIRKFVGLPNSFISIYPSILDVNELDAHTDNDLIDSDEYREFRMVKKGFPPIIVRRDLNGKLYLVDGNHRVYWAQRNDYRTIGAWVIDEIMQRDIMRGELGKISETRIITPEESLYDGYITLYHGTIWPLALKAKKGELGPQNMEKLIVDVLVNVYHETPQDAKEYYEKYSKSRKEDPNVIFFTTDKSEAEDYARVSIKYGGELFYDVLGNYLWDKNKGINNNNVFEKLQTNEPAVVTVNVPLSMVLSHPNWSTPFRSKIRQIMKNIRNNPEIKGSLSDNFDFEVFVKENIPARFVQRIDRVPLKGEK